MYNEQLKSKFIIQQTKDVLYIKQLRGIFESAEASEISWGGDICTMPYNVILDVITSIYGTKHNSQNVILGVFKRYVIWCMDNGVPNANSDILQIEAGDVGIIKKKMVASPFQLQEYLNALFSMEYEETIDNVYRGFLWLAYSGVLKKDVYSIKVSDVDISNRTIKYNNRYLPIYKEAVPAFKNLVELNAFKHEHAGYKNTISRSRVDSDVLLRGIKSVGTMSACCTSISDARKKAIQWNRTDKNISYSESRFSGVYYRMYIAEKSGVEADVTNIIESDLSNGVKSKKTIYGHLKDYELWKKAFYEE